MARTRAVPQTKGVYTPLPESAYLYRNLIPYQNPEWLDGNKWRYIGRASPVIQDVIATLTMHVQTLPWEIRPKKVEDAKKLSEDIKYHTDIFNNAQDGAGYLSYLSILMEDFNLIPFGAGTETVRYAPTRSDKDERGKLYKILAIDGATFFPVNDPTGNVVAVQSSPYTDNRGTNIVFDKKELVRMYRFPRPEVQRRGWGMPPLEKVYLAVELLLRGDKYFANLLLDTPEAGILDLGDMSEDSAKKWAENFKIMFSGLDPFKVPILYEHNTPAKWIPFGRPPTEISYNETYDRYAQIAVAAYGLTLSDIGWRGSGGSLAGSIREERKSRSTGYGAVRQYFEKHFSYMLPSDLEFKYIDVDDEKLVSLGRARSANAVAGRNLIESGAISPQRWAKQMEIDGLLTPVNEEPKLEDFEITMELKNPGATTEPEPVNTGLGAQRNVRGARLRDEIQGKDNVPASAGGMGEIKTLKAYYPGEISALRSLVYDNLLKIVNKANRPRCRRLVKSALKNSFSVMKTAIIENPNLDVWRDELIAYYFDNRSAIQTDDIVVRAVNNILDGLDPIFEKDGWWKLDIPEEMLYNALSRYYRQGLIDGAMEIQERMYEDELVDTPDANIKIDDIDFMSDAPFALRYKVLMDIINDGTLYYLKRLSSAVILEAEKLPSISQKIAAGEDIDQILTDDNLVDYFADQLKLHIGEVFIDRADNIANFESRTFYNLGFLRQAEQAGVTGKYLIHNGSDEPCAECVENIQRGIVPLDFEFVNKFGTNSKTAPFHPECHCIVRLSVKGMKPGQPKFFEGE